MKINLEKIKNDIKKIYEVNYPSDLEFRVIVHKGSKNHSVKSFTIHIDPDVQVKDDTYDTQTGFTFTINDNGYILLQHIESNETYFGNGEIDLMLYIWNLAKQIKNDKEIKYI